MDDDLRSLVQGSVRQALVRSDGDVADALAEFGWRELAESDEALAHTTLFEEQGVLAADTDALDVAAAAALGLDGAATVLWPHRSSTSGTRTGDGGIDVDGVGLRGLAGDGRPLLVPVAGAVLALSASSLDAAPLGGMARGTAWVRVTGRTSPGTEVGAWDAVERRALLALASELVGVSQRIVDVAAEQVSTRRQFGKPLGTYQAVRFRLAEAYADTAGARALVASAWEDGSLVAARSAKAVAGTAHDAVAKHAMQVCGAIGLSEEHPLPALVRRGFALAALLDADPFAPVAGAPAASGPGLASALDTVGSAVAVGRF